MWNGSVNRFEGLMSEGYFWATEDTGSKAKAKVIHISYACEEVMKSSREAEMPSLASFLT